MRGQHGRAHQGGIKAVSNRSPRRRTLEADMPAPAMNPLAGRITIVLAAAGYGKTCAVRAWLGATRAAWYSGADLPGATAAPDGDRVTVVDDLQLASANALTAVLPTVPARSRLILL